MKLIKVNIIFCLLFLITACSPSQKEAFSATLTAVEQEFNKDAASPNKKAGNYDAYIPENMEVQTEDKNNFLIDDGDHTYILFINPLEPKNSKILFKVLQEENKSILLDSFVQKKEFGFINISSMDKKEYEVVVGIGGVKMTTVTKIGDLEETARLMMKMVKSINY